jgi:hypothetical protein
LVSDVNRITAAESSRITATKMKHQAAITAERKSGAVMSASVRNRVAPSMRPASSSSGWTAWKADESCWYALTLDQVVERVNDEAYMTKLGYSRP